MFQSNFLIATSTLKKVLGGFFAAALVLSTFPTVAFGATNENEEFNACGESNLIANSSFEQPVVTDPENWDVFPSPVDNWEVEWVDATPEPGKPEVANLELQKAGYYASADGDQFAELDSNWSGPGGEMTSPHNASVLIYQDIETIPGATYELQFAFSAKPGYDATDNRLAITWDGNAVDTVDADGSSLTDTSWGTYTYSLTATASSTRLQFADAGVSNTFGTFLDATSLRCTELPEVPPTPGNTACSDGIDNDGDGLVDMADGGCDSPADDREHNGGRGGGGGGGGSVLGASTGPEPQVLGESCGMYITTYIKLGADNDEADVMRLQTFLNENMGTSLPVTGFFGPMTMEVLKAFQVKYKDEILTPWTNYGLTPDEAENGTGYVYKTTQRWINMLKCAELNLPVPQLP